MSKKIANPQAKNKNSLFPKVYKYFYNYWLFGLYPSSCFFKNNVFETGFYLRPHVRNLLSWSQSLDLVPIYDPELSIGPEWVGFTWERRENPVSETFLKKSGQWIMSRKLIAVLIYHRHKLLDLMYIFAILYHLILYKLLIKFIFPVSPSRPSDVTSGTRPVSL
jgi:hypothetical protein